MQKSQTSRSSVAERPVLSLLPATCDLPSELDDADPEGNLNDNPSVFQEMKKKFVHLMEVNEEK